MAIEHGFDFFREHLAPGEIDYRGLAANQKEKTVRVHAANVASMKPPVAQNFFSRQPGGGISVKGARTGNCDFTAAFIVGCEYAHMMICDWTTHGIPSA